MYKTKHELPEMTRAAEQFGDRHGSSPEGSRMASIILSQLQNPTARKPTSKSSCSNPCFLSLSLGL
jgi:hypothetical protein